MIVSTQYLASRRKFKRLSIGMTLGDEKGNVWIVIDKIGGKDPIVRLRAFGGGVEFLVHFHSAFGTADLSHELNTKIKSIKQ